MSGDIAARCETIEECYEFMLGYAGQGLAGEDSGPIRDCLDRMSGALSGIEDSYSAAVKQDNLQSSSDYTAFGAVLEADAHAAHAAVRLVLAQPSISSQLVDNLNASIHLRSLLTDLFLIDEVLKSQRARLNSTASSS
jgi:hypothetical protein